MDKLSHLLRYLNKRSLAGTRPGGYSGLLLLLHTIEDSLEALIEQDEWIKDGYFLDEETARTLADTVVQDFLSTLIMNTEDFGEAYLIDQLVGGDVSNLEATQKALDAWKAEHPPMAVNNDYLGDLDEHPF